GFIGLLKLKEANSSIIGHEHTRIQPKEDRLRLLRATNANLCPIFTLFLDRQRLLEKVYKRFRKISPLAEVLDQEGVLHKLWKIKDSELIDKLKDYLYTKKIFIADGHHRYEVACLYRKELREKFKDLKEADFDYLLTYFTNGLSKDLVILPIHRIVKLKNCHLEGLFGILKDHFFIKEIKNKTTLINLLQKEKNNGKTAFGMYKDKRYWILRLKSDKILNELAKDKPKAYRKLEVVIFNLLILKKILKVNSEEDLIFLHKVEDLVSEVDKNKDYLGFILNPLDIKEMLKVVRRGLKLPAKSTYFYPKLLSGLLIHKFDF
ncbi:MAG: DUF1015 domain-containing protein, partial [Candidatus Omnitrophica bacterium]|nr:DUF1015 domain-containing protein [Candidatus Omnitrophota bacterium]